MSEKNKEVKVEDQKSDEIKKVEESSAKKSSKKFVKKQSNQSKVDAINASKLPDAEKKAYIERLQGKKEDSNKDVSFEVYASIKNFRSGEYAGKKALAKSKKQVKMNQKAWDDFFKKF